MRITPLHDCLRDCGLPCPGKSVEPEDGGFVEVFGPRFDLVQDSLLRAREAASAISTLIDGPTSTGAVFQY